VSALSDGPFPGWEAFLPHLVHPVKVAVVEALLSIGEPLSAAQLAELFRGEGEGFGETNVRYHSRHLVEVGILEIVPSDPDGEESPKGKLFYFTPHDRMVDSGQPE
jgi:hypothetical protein